MSTGHAIATPRKSGLDGFLNLFSEVRGGEGLTALLLTLNVFVLLTTYYIIKPVREALILGTPGGAEIKAYAGALQAALLLLAVPAYGLLVDRFARRKLITVVTLFFAACMVVFYAFVRAEAQVGVAFFLWVGIFNLMVIAQFWSLANDIYSEEEGKRLFPIVAFGASAGAVCGSAITGALIGPLGVNQLLLVSASLLVASLGLTYGAEAARAGSQRRVSPSSAMAPSPASVATASAAAAVAAPKKSGPLAAFALVLGKPYLLWIALLILVLNWVNTTGEYILGKTVARAAEEAIAAGTAGGLDKKQFIGKFYSDFFFGVNLLGIVLQLFVVSRLIKFFGVRRALFFLPVIALFGYLALAFVPLLSIVRWVKTAENATDYSVQNTVRQALFLPTSKEEKYKAKQAIDTFFVRSGDMLSALLVWLGATKLHFEPRQFALVNLVLVGFWLWFAVRVSGEHRRIATS